MQHKLVILILVLLVWVGSNTSYSVETYTYTLPAPPKSVSYNVGGEVIKYSPITGYNPGPVFTMLYNGDWCAYRTDEFTYQDIPHTAWYRSCHNSDLNKLSIYYW